MPWFYESTTVGALQFIVLPIEIWIKIHSAGAVAVLQKFLVMITWINALDPLELIEINQAQLSQPSGVALAFTARQVDLQPAFE